jgi:hypothetical protein
MDDKLQRDGDAVRKLCQEMERTTTPFEEDMNFAVKQLQSDGTNQFWRRTVIRCFFATTEALLWHMKHIAPNLSLISGVALTDDELANAKGMKWVVRSKGKVQRRLNFRDNVRASFALFAKSFGVPITIKYDAGFDAFCETYKLRNRLMHPKKPSDPDVSDAEIATGQRGVAWFVQSYEVLTNPLPK